MSTTAAGPYMVRAPLFLAWWQRMIELNEQLPEEMSEFEWLSRGQEIRSLVGDLSEVGIAAGAVTPYASDNADGSFEFGDTLVADFDWEHGEIDFQANEYYGNDGLDRGRSLVARLVKITGIPES